jgi:hypothetical protein
MELPELEEIKAIKFWCNGLDPFILVKRHKQIRGLGKPKKRKIVSKMRGRDAIK